MRKERIVYVERERPPSLAWELLKLSFGVLVVAPLALSAGLFVVACFQ